MWLVEADLFGRPARFKIKQTPTQTWRSRAIAPADLEPSKGLELGIGFQGWGRVGSSATCDIEIDQQVLHEFMYVHAGWCCKVVLYEFMCKVLYTPGIPRRSTICRAVLNQSIGGLIGVGDGGYFYILDIWYRCVGEAKNPAEYCTSTEIWCCWFGNRLAEV